MYPARPALLTVFSITQFEHSITQSDSCHHGFADAHIKILQFDIFLLEDFNEKEI
jgi:hypothetical protein